MRIIKVLTILALALAPAAAQAQGLGEPEVGGGVAGGTHRDPRGLVDLVERGVTQPLKSMAPMDQAFAKMLNDIVLLIVGGIGGIMTKRVTKAAANAFGTTPQPPMLYSAQPMGYGQPMGYQQPFGQPMGFQQPFQQPNQAPNFNWMNFNNAQLDESWTPGPPPTTSPDHLHPEREEIAAERAAARSEE